MTLRRKGRRICIVLETELDTALEALVKSKGGRAGRVSKSHEINVAVANYLAREYASGPLGPLRDAVDEVIRERLDQVEAWLRPMLANSGINATAALLASVEVICGTRLPKEKVVEFVDVLRGRAYKLYRRPMGESEGRA